ncbi:MAG: ROK family protein [Acidobacteria bacterium]|nr:ROK family protein [Acidobacteriota bacterium]MBU4330357.1 ROK family protein [Acidobacteriota bacterium]MBU4494958.1 ROK family protein [Acidobacteriota bacterium]
MPPKYGSLHAGFDVGGTRVKYGLCASGGAVAFEGETAVPEYPDDLFALLKKLFRTLKREAGSAVDSVGLGLPGLFDVEDRIIRRSPHCPCLDGLPLLPRLERIFEGPVFFHNEADLAAYGEYAAGAGQGADSLVLITVGTGIGSGIVLNGKLWEGIRGYAGELGHVRVNPGGEHCACGRVGCLETEVSAPAVLRHYKARAACGDDIRPEDILRRAVKGDVNAVFAFSRAGRALGEGIALLINVLNPECILVGGGMMRAGGLLLDPALEQARALSFKAAFDVCRIQKAGLGNSAGWIGAALWAADKGKP